ncbi:MAG: ABC transporter permease [Acidobacteriaceae bacterium]|nr:ABC transporter permease [Acidobacteriaceae bacterium]
MSGSYRREIVYTCRLLLKSPVVTAVAVISIALGIGANTAIFSLMNALMLRPLPVSEPNQLVSVSTVIADDPNGDEGFSSIMAQEITKSQQVFSSVLSYFDLGDMSTFEANGIRFAGSLDQVDGNYYSTLGVQPFLGRLIRPSDVARDEGTSEPVAVITYRCWESRYDADPAIVGKTIRIDGRPSAIIGVSPKSFNGLIIDGSSEVTVPIATPGAPVYRGRDTLWLHLVGRLKPGITVEQARAQLTALWPHIQENTVPETYDAVRRARFFTRRIRVESSATGVSYLRPRFSRPLILLMGLVALVLLIACVNLANLMLARAAGRQQEIGIRVALGAGQWQLLRQLLIESLMLSLAGAALGLLIAVSASRFLANMLWTGYVPLTLELGPNLRVLGFTAGVAILTAILFGVAPALKAMRTDPAIVLREKSRAVIGGAGLIRKILVSGQIALALVLVIGAMLLTRSLGNLRATNLGFESGRLLVMQLIRQPGRAKIVNRAAYYQQLATQISGVPGVESATYSYGAPTSRYEVKEQIFIPSASSPPLEAVVEFIGPNFFRTLGMHVLAGREFDWRDNENSPHVVVLSESLAGRLFPNQNPIGQKIDLGPRPEHKGMQVVGVVNSASLWRPQSQKPLAVYMALLQEPRYNDPLVVLRAAQDPATLKNAAQHAVESLGQHYPLRIETLEERWNVFLAEQRVTAMLSGCFGALALLLASVGIYGVMSYAVARRTSEIGVRMALGAERGSVLALVLREVMWLSLAGTAIGIPVALATSHLVSGMLFGLSSSDPASIASAVALLIIVAIIAGYLPARRASRIDPMSALRAE